MIISASTVLEYIVKGNDSQSINIQQFIIDKRKVKVVPSKNNSCNIYIYIYIYIYFESNVLVTYYGRC